MKIDYQSNIIDVGFCTFSKRLDGIIEMRCKGHTYTVKELHEMLPIMKFLAGGKTAPFLFIAHEKSMLDAQALKYFSTPEASQYSSAEAYVLKSKIQKVLANIFLTVSNTTVPTKAFNNEKDAIAWLNKAKEAK